jgi:hypothetical protein
MTAPRAEVPALVLVDCRCGHCTNCGNDTLVGLFSARHEVGQGVLGRGKCPACGNNTCHWDRLATPDEIPGGAA